MFAHAMAAQLSCHVQKMAAIDLSEFGWDFDHISILMEIVSEMGLWTVLVKIDKRETKIGTTK